MAPPAESGAVAAGSASLGSGPSTTSSRPGRFLISQSSQTSAMTKTMSEV